MAACFRLTPSPDGAPADATDVAQNVAADASSLGNTVTPDTIGEPDGSATEDSIGQDQVDTASACSPTTAGLSVALRASPSESKATGTRPSA